MIGAFWKYVICGLVACAFSCASLFAHQNTIILLKGKTLVGLPSKYSPAELDLESLRLRIGGHVMEFPPLLRSFFTRQPYDLEVSASWYGEGTPTLVLEITPKGKDYTYIVALELDTLRSTEIYVTLRGSAGPPETFTMQTLRIELTDSEKKQLDESVTNVR